MRFIFLSLAGIVFSLSSFLQAENLEFGTSKKNFDQVHLNRVEIFQSQDRNQDVRLETVNYSGKKHNLIYLNFEMQTTPLLQDMSKYFQIQKSAYLSSTESHNGKYAALFNSHRHGIWIESTQKIFESQEGLNQNFTIEAWVKPFFLYPRSILLQKNSFVGKRKKGIEIGIEKNLFFTKLQNLFQNEKGDYHSVTLWSQQKVSLHKWHHVAFTYDAKQSRLSLYLNGKEQHVFFARDSKRIWPMQIEGTPESPNNSPFIIGKSFVGLIDEFRISGKCLSPERAMLHTSSYAPLDINYETQLSKQKEGEIISSVLSPAGKKTIQFSRVSYRSLVPKETSLHVYVRHSQTPFLKNASLPSWHRIKKKYLALPTFRYFQWRANLRSDPLGKDTPILKSLTLQYTPVPLLPSPRTLRIVENKAQLNPLQVSLKWESSPRPLDDENAGYYIYYGLRSRDYLGRLEFYVDKKDGILKRIGTKTKVNHLNKSLPLLSQKQTQDKKSLEKNLSVNQVEITVDNKLILKNLSEDQKKRLPLLRYNTNYYFSVSAYDQVGESQFSNEVYLTIPPR